MHKYSNVTSILICGLIYTNTVAIAQNNNIHIEKFIIQGPGSSAGDNNKNIWNSGDSRPSGGLPSWPSNNRPSGGLPSWPSNNRPSDGLPSWPSNNRPSGGLPSWPSNNRPSDGLPSWPSNNRPSSSKSPTYSGYTFCLITGAIGHSTGFSTPGLATTAASLDCLLNGGNAQECQNNVFYLSE